jgi:hypothetical protein
MDSTYNSNLPNGEIPEITCATNPEEGFQDILLAIRRVSLDSAGDCTLEAAGRFEGSIVGLEILIKAGMRPGIIQVGDEEEIDPTAVHVDGILFRSIGKPTGELIRALSKLYEVPSKSPEARDVVAFVGIALDGDPRQIREQHIRLKLFHDPWDKDCECCELFLHVDLPDRLIGIHEKDQEYRPAVIRALAAR